MAQDQPTRRSWNQAFWKWFGIVAGIFTVVVVYLSIGAPILWHLWLDFSLNRVLRKGLHGPVKVVEWQPNTDAPRQWLTDPDKISVLRGWLWEVDVESPGRSAPPPCVCEMRFVFEDGREAVIRHSTIPELRIAEGRTDYRSEVRVYFQGHWGSGDGMVLAAILEPDE